MKSYFFKECRRIFHDKGVMIIFFAAGILYPLLYGYIYYNETVDSMPVSVVDLSESMESRRFCRKLDATKEVDVIYRSASLHEAKQLMKERRINGIIMFPEDYADRLAAGMQTTVSTYADMSSFMYYKNLVMAVNYVMLDEMHCVGAPVKVIPYKENILYNKGLGFGTFFLPAAFMLIIQQTLFFGLAMMNGTLRENRKSPFLSVRELAGRSLAYISVYTTLALYIVTVVPRIFGIPHEGGFIPLLIFMTIFVTACVMFTMVFSYFIRHRETGLVYCLFFTLIMLFLSGFSWPLSNMPEGWKLLSYLFPSSFAIRGYIKINSAGADLHLLAPEIAGLCMHVAAYAIICMWLAYMEKRKSAALHTEFIS